MRKYMRPPDAEEYSEFHFKDRYYFGDRILPYVLKGICSTWNSTTELPVPPVLFQLMLYREFRFRFNSSWKPAATAQGQIAESAKVVQNWTNPSRGCSDRGESPNFHSIPAVPSRILKLSTRIMRTITIITTNITSVANYFGLIGAYPEILCDP